MTRAQALSRAFAAFLAAAATAPAFAGGHFYAVRRGAAYGYASTLTPAEKAAGVVSKPLTLITYGGRNGDRYTFTEISDPRAIRNLACKEPCRLMVVTTYAGGHVLPQVIPVTAGSILAGIMDDARAGNLEPYKPAR